jgi:opacity protein-like surface antigen
MNKKWIIFLILVVLVTVSVFAFPEFSFSAGAGGYFTSDFGGGFKGTRGNDNIAYLSPYGGGGGFVFLDATFAELTVGFFRGDGGVGIDTNGNWDVFNYDHSFDLSLLGLDIGFMLKYPISTSSRLSLYPQLGIAYRIILNMKAEENRSDEYDSIGDAIDYSALWFRLGGGLDYSFTSNIYLRGGFTYGVRLPNKFEKDMVDTFGSNTRARLGHGLDLKLGVGFKL